MPDVIGSMNQKTFGRLDKKKSFANPTALVGWHNKMPASQGCLNKAAIKPGMEFGSFLIHMQRK